MKTIVITALSCFVLSSLFSCKKDKVDLPTIVGLWKGKYSNSLTSYPTNGYAFLFRSNGTVRVYNNTDTISAGTLKAEGTYSVTNSIVTTTYSYISPGSGTYSTKASVDSKFTFQEGTWGNGTTNNTAVFFLNKQ